MEHNVSSRIRSLVGTTLIALFFSFSFPYPLYAEEGPIYRKFLVQNEPLPYGFLLENDVVTTSTSFQHEDNLSGVEPSFHREKKFIDTYPALLLNRENFFISAGGGYMEDYFGEKLGNRVDKYYTGAYGSLYGTGSFNSSWLWSFYSSYGVFSRGNPQFDKTNDKYFQSAQTGFKKNDNWILKTGLLYNSNFGKDMILPLIGTTYYSYGFGHGFIWVYVTTWLQLSNCLRIAHSLARFRRTAD
jgi:hypothetical protein